MTSAISRRSLYIRGHAVRVYRLVVLTGAVVILSACTDVSKTKTTTTTTTETPSMRAKTTETVKTRTEIERK